MKYMTRKRYKKKCIQGDVNIPFGTELNSIGNMLYYKDKPVCIDTSQDAFDYFVSNEDDNGVQRADLINWILDHTAGDKVKDKNKYERIWKMIWANSRYHRFKRQDNEERWLWYKDFYTAPIDDLQMLVNDIKTIEQGDC